MTSSTTPGSPVADLAPPVAIACHDAGGANLIAAWCAKAPPGRWRAHVAGPAAAIWRRRFGDTGLAASLEEALDGAATLLSGTGWGSDLEHRARQLARRQGVFSVAVLDHWVNYEQRFVRDGERVLPSQLWVVDADALRIAAACFPGASIRQQPNSYLQEQVAQVGPAADAADLVLYVLEPVRDTWGGTTPGEFQALDFFAARLPLLRLSPGTEVRLRPHPSDEPGKYDGWAMAHPELRCTIDRSATLAEAMSRARWVAGCESYAMVVALHAGRRVLCTLPPWAPACRLPQAGIEHLRDLG